MGSALNVISHNMMAMFSDRQLGITTNNKAKSAERLSSGYRINRAADDAAGLSISERMRKLIRGLDQGSENVQDGISLVQVADGALDEVTDCLKRIAELSIKAYNGTNSYSDRLDMQKEVDQLLSETQRIADTTKFNETLVLKAKGKETLLDPVPPHYEYIVEKTVTDKPDWLSVDDTLSLGNSADITSKQRIDLNARRRTGGGDTPEDKTDDTYDYYGPANSAYDANPMYTYKGAWTEALTNNASASIDFSGLASSSNTAQELLDNMLKLIGSSIGVPCSTCNNELYGVSFTGSEEELIVTSGGFQSYESGQRTASATVDISELTIEDKDGNDVNAMQQIRNMIESHETDTTASDDDKKAEVKALADKIAKSLGEEAFKSIDEACRKEGHFDQAVKESDYRVVLYDYRDAEFFEGTTAVEDPKVETTANVIWTKRIEVQDPPIQRTVPVDYAVSIQCSDGTSDKIDIILPHIDNKYMKIEGYNIAKYRTETKLDYSNMAEKQARLQKEYEKEKAEYEKKKAEYDKAMEEYDKKLAEFEEAYNKWNNGGEGVKYNTVKVWSEGSPETIEIVTTVHRNPYFDDYGEQQYEEYTTQEELKHEAVPAGFVDVKQYIPAPKPPVMPMLPVEPTMKEAQPDVLYASIYDPDEVEIIYNALDYVSDCRARLGAIQNRLEHTYKNNQNKLENTTAAESRIRDTNMADEMVKYSNYNILQQAGQSMLAQANQSRDYILGLLG